MISQKALGLLPKSLRSELLMAFNQIVTNFREGRWEPSELNGGKICEVVYSILSGYISGSYPQRPIKPRNMVSACSSLANAPTSIPRSVRIQIPRVLIGLYEVRNNRGVGHIGGEVNPNQMDAVLVLFSSKWIMAELVRIFHNVDTTEATKIVESLIEKEVCLIWNVGDKLRILQEKGLSTKEKSLLLLYYQSCPLLESDLVSYIEYSNSSVFRRDVLVPGHKARLWEYDKRTGEVIISPLGIEYVESRLLQNH